MSQRPAAKREPLDGLQRSRYSKIKDINSGSYGFVQLCQDSRTNEQVAVKFIERGEKVLKHLDAPCAESHACLKVKFLPATPQCHALKSALLVDHKVCREGAAEPQPAVASPHRSVQGGFPHK